MVENLIQKFDGFAMNLVQTIAETQQFTPLLFHYTSTSALKKILEGKKFRFTHFKDLNDSSELIYAVEKLSDKIQPIFTLLAQDEKDADIKKMFLNFSKESKNYNPNGESFSFYLFSFCREENYYPAWRSYGDEGKGVAIGFKFSALNRIVDAHMEKKIKLFSSYNLIAHEIIYQEEILENKISTPIYIWIQNNLNLIKQLLPIDKIRFYTHVIACINTNACLFKHPAYSSENEWRVTATAFDSNVFPQSPSDDFSRRSNLIEFEPDDIEKIYFGPCMSEEKIAQIKDWLNKHGYEQVAKNSEKSDIPYRGK